MKNVKKYFKLGKHSFSACKPKNARELTQLFDGLDPEKHRAIYIECKNFYIEAIRSDPNQFLIIAKILAHDELKEVYLSCKNEILSLLKNHIFMNSVNS
ncbi:MAG: hypothetical protein HWD59_08025 [Coxiellaceae bacterium]|nr:MAG: hypothetical protein HWD59_08025 [Coxiellaceae bacterium]